MLYRIYVLCKYKYSELMGKITLCEKCKHFESKWKDDESIEVSLSAHLKNEYAMKHSIMLCKDCYKENKKFVTVNNLCKSCKYKNTILLGDNEAPVYLLRTDDKEEKAKIKICGKYLTRRRW